MVFLNTNYEISIWEQQEQNETKVAIIGHPNMRTGAKAHDPRLTRNTNGEKTLTFYLFYEFLDETEGVVKRNPFCSLLNNGRKIKLKWRDKWYEFNITNIEENSTEKKITYTAKDSFIIELAKRGFQVELSTELENNQGTLFELGDRILDKSDWTIDKENSKIGPQVLEEVLVELKVIKQITATEKAVLDSDNLLHLEKRNFNIEEGKKIYTFYSTIHKKDPFFQFFYLEDENYEFDDDNFLINCPLYSVDNYKFSNDLPKNTSNLELTHFRGKKLIRTQQSRFNSLLNTYVQIYENDEQEIIGYTETEYLTEDYVTNLVTNSDDFVSEVGWYGCSETAEVEAVSYPDGETALALLNAGKQVEAKSFLRLNFDTLNKWSYYNTGFNDNKFTIKNLTTGQKFVVKIKYGYRKTDNLSILPKNIGYNKKTKKMNSGINIGLCTYEYDDDGYPKILKTIFSTEIEGDEENTFKKDGDYWTAICTCDKQFSKNQLDENNFAFFFKYETTENSSIDNISNYYFYIEDLQIFDYKERIELEDNEKLPYYLPGEIVDGESRTKYYYFLNSEENESCTDKDDIIYLYQDYKPASFEKKYYTNYTQIRTINGKESNIYNLIQNLCETFNCWADFVVEHNSLGYIKKDSKGNFIKKIVFKPYIGKENWSGFKRGINLKNIKRILNSEQIVTKTIVKANSNEFAPNGFCTIAYSDENPSGESFIYDFSFYELKNLINSNQLKKDLYGQNGLYTFLKTLNNKIKQLTEKQSAASLALIEAEKNKEVQKALVSELSTSLATAKKDFRLYCGITYKTFLKLDDEDKESYLKLQGVSETFVTILTSLDKLEKAEAEFKIVKEQFNQQKKIYRDCINERNKLTRTKEEIILDFETKYAAYIHEGSWISEEYIDHNLYYMDALVVAANSSKPKVTYNIDVIDISSLEEFFNYKIDIGDKTYIIDPEFFGYHILKDGIKTPIKQEVVITELVEVLENPQENKVVVQNYKNQFDDLFQRITATSQQLQLNSGNYERAASSFNNTGLSSSATQNSLNSINFLLQNNTIKWDADGFISTNTQNKHEFLKIQNGSLLLTKDGGNNWSAAINGKGINADYIYGGQIDAGKINIVSELKTGENQQLKYALTMGKEGLTMYSYEGEQQVRVRLGKIYENNDYDSELYGLQLYNSKGEQTFKTDSDGNITMSGTIHAQDGDFKGKVIANSGLIGGWTIDKNSLTHKINGTIDALINTDFLDSNYVVNSYSSNSWRLLFGIDGNTGNFGIDSNGNLYANGVDIKDGNISFGDIFKITTNGGKDGVISYGLNIDLDPENEDKSIVIETDDRVIGIREKVKDDNGNEERDEFGNPKWTWKTILGDLTNATLGKQSLKDLGIEGYGLCTENGLFSGTIIAGAGKIGGFTITDHTISKDLTNYPPSDGELTEEQIKKEYSFFPTLDTSDTSNTLKQCTGVYIGDDGKIFLGDEKQYIKYDKEKLIIATKELRIITSDDETLSLEERIDKVANPVAGYSFSNEGLIIYNKDDDNKGALGITKTVIDSDGMDVFKKAKNTENGEIEWQEVLVADADGVKAEDLQATTYLIINDKSRFETWKKDDKTYYTACFWIGG